MVVVLSASGPIRKAGRVLGCVCMCCVLYASGPIRKAGGGKGGGLLSASGPIRKVRGGGGGGGAVRLRLD